MRWLGFPDAAFGAVAYGTELALELFGGRRTLPTLMLGGIAAAMAAGGIVLVALQGVYGHWCFLCLVSAAASWGILALLLPDVRVAVAEERLDMAGGRRG